MTRRLLLLALAGMRRVACRADPSRHRRSRSPRSPESPTSRGARSPASTFPIAAPGRRGRPTRSGWTRRGWTRRFSTRSPTRALATRTWRSSRRSRSARASPTTRSIGPTQPRGSLSGLVIRRGYVVAEWGPTDRVDMTHSVTKTFLSTVVGLAWQRGLISRRERSGRRLRAASSGSSTRSTTRRSPGITCCGRPATGRARCGASPTGRIGPKATKPADWPNRKLSPPGTRYKYNDVRVNLLVALRAARLAPAAARGAARGGDGADRRLEHAGAGTATTTRGSSSMASGCSRSAAAATGAAACSSTPATWRASAICSCATARGRTARSSRRSGSRWRARPARPTPSTAT